MSSTVAPAPQSMRNGTPWGARVAVIALLLAVLIGPALVVLALQDSGDGGDATLRVARLPTDVAVEGDTVWVASGPDDRIVAIDGAQPEDPPIRHETGSAPLRVAVGAQGEPIAAGRAPGALAVTRGGVVVLDSDLGEVLEIDPDSERVSRVLHVGGFPASIAVGGGAAWVVDSRAGTVTRIPG